MSEERHTTAEVALLCGVTVATIRKWKARGDLPSAPSGRAGQGRGNECYWTDAGVAEAKARAAENRNGGYRRTPALATASKEGGDTPVEPEEETRA